MKNIDVIPRPRLFNDDYSLTEEDERLSTAARSLLQDVCPISVVRASEAQDKPGFDNGVWRHLVAFGVVSMGLPTGVGGDGGGLTELALVAEQLGAFIAPVPVIDVSVSARLLARVGTNESLKMVRQVLETDMLVSLATRPLTEQPRQLVSSGAVAEHVVGRTADSLIVLQCPKEVPPAPNIAAAPLAWLDIRGLETTLTVTSPSALAAYAEAINEWHLLTGAVAVGAASRAVALAVEYAKTRAAFGNRIGAFQAVSHPLVDAHCSLEGARRLIRKAAWLADAQSDAAPAQMQMAWLFSIEAAKNATRVSMHMHGGLGVTLECDQQLYFRRVAGWTAMATNSQEHLEAVGKAIVASRSAEVPDGL